jgi:hypothetical protein
MCMVEKHAWDACWSTWMSIGFTGLWRSATHACINTSAHWRVIFVAVLVHMLVHLPCLSPLYTFYHVTLEGQLILWSSPTTTINAGCLLQPQVYVLSYCITLMRYRQYHIAVGHKKIERLTLPTIPRLPQEPSRNEDHGVVRSIASMWYIRDVAVRAVAHHSTYTHTRSTYTVRIRWIQALLLSKFAHHHSEVVEPCYLLWFSRMRLIGVLHTASRIAYYSVLHTLLPKHKTIADCRSLPQCPIGLPTTPT